jgi:PRTRC genetic system protein A
MASYSQSAFERPLSGKEAFEAMFLQTVMDYRIGLEGTPTKPLSYVMAENGMFEVRHNAIGTFTRKIEKVPDLKPLKEGFQWNVPKLPWEMYEKAVGFFRQVMAEFSNAESYIQFFYDREKNEYFGHVPRQRVSGGGVSFDRDQVLEQKHLLVMEAHSHNTMNAFWSSVDNADEKADRLFMVIGALNNQTPEVKIRCGMAGHYIDMTIEQVFEKPIGPDIPRSWLDQIETSSRNRELQKIKDMFNAHPKGSWHAQAKHQEVLFDGRRNVPGAGVQGPGADSVRSPQRDGGVSPGSGQTSAAHSDRGVRRDRGVGGASRGENSFEVSKSEASPW